MQKGWFVRKLLVAFFSTSLLSIYLAQWYTTIESERFPYDLHSTFLGWFVIYFAYSGVVIFIYGGFVSIVLELISTKLMKLHWLIYLCLHAMLGLPFGLFTYGAGALMGGGTALVFGMTDLWLRQRSKLKLPRKTITLVIPIVIVVIMTTIFAFVSPERPPFTKEEAILEAHESRGVYYDHFPEEEGVWTGKIKGYDVKQEVSVEEKEQEVYHVTFRETWEKGEEKGSWYWTYEIRRNGMSSVGGHDETPGYYE